jgi:H+-translocating NAD(P) transhydrogenase subunit alpha
LERRVRDSLGRSSKASANKARVAVSRSGRTTKTEGDMSFAEGDVEREEHPRAAPQGGEDVARARTIGIPSEIEPGEGRVAVDPETVQRFVEMGYAVLVERGAGARAQASDDSYAEAGAEIVDDRRELWERANLVLKIHPPREIPGEDLHEIDLLSEGDILVSLFFPAQNQELLERAKKSRATVLALDAVPRISRAQAVDVLSSMAVLAGYRAVVEAASNLERAFGAQVTAAGSTPPANVLIIGAGVAGLSAIATATDLGARVKAFDVRPAVKSEVESVGGEFLLLDFELDGDTEEGGYAKEMDQEFIEAELELFRREIPNCDVVISTASIPGKIAPRLVLQDMVESMKPGSVVVDLAAATGGNCELTLPDEIVEHRGVRVVGPTNLPTKMARQASSYFGRNLANLVALFGSAEQFELNEGDEVIRGMLVVRDGEVKWPPPVIEPSPRPAGKEQVSAAERREKLARHREERERRRELIKAVSMALAAVVMVLVGAFAPPTFVENFTLFVLACVIGWLLVWNVSPSLHTPLISVTNAISGIIIIGGVTVATAGTGGVVLALGAVAAGIAAVNVFGGFLVTHRMLGMFRSEAEMQGTQPTER